MITKQEIKQQTKGVLLAMGTWLIVVPGSELLKDIIPIKNQMILGAIIIAVVLFWD